MDYNLGIDESQVYGSVEACAEEILNHVLSWDSWPDSIIPTQPGCPDVVFQPERFDKIESVWTCDDNKEGKTLQ